MENQQAQLSSTLDSPTNPPQALIFDMDGVICDTMPYHLKAWSLYIARTPELPDTMREHLHRMGGKRNSELLQELIGDHLTEAEIQHWGGEKEALYRDLIREEIVCLPGLIGFLTQARAQGLKLGLGTSACRENVDLLLAHQDLRRFFEVLVIETDVERGKPDPQCYQLVAQRLGVDPEQCLVFEDATVGVQAARNAKMRCWGVLTTETEAALQAAGAEFCIQDFTDPRLQSLLGKVAVS